MSNTLAIHYVRSAYGLWLPGEDRGHWSEAWDDQIGFIEPHTLHAGDPVRLRIAQERMKHPPVPWNQVMQNAITRTLARCAAESPWKVLEYCIEETHFHALLTPSPFDIDRTVKWVGQQMTKAVHAATGTDTPIFCKGRWLQFIFEQSHYDNLDGYIQRHNLRQGRAGKPYDFTVG
jgi:REP element-mobilizing transposase RayT